MTLEEPDAAGEVTDMKVAAAGAEVSEGGLEIEEVVLVEAAGSAAGEDVSGKLVGVLGADELVVVRGADVDEGRDGRRAVGRVKGRVVDGIAVDLADIKVVLDLSDTIGRDAVGDAPDLIRGVVVVVREGVPVGSLDEGDDTTGCLGGTSMILAGLQKGMSNGVGNGVGNGVDNGVGEAEGSWPSQTCQKRRT